jgi:hypothetical protein
MSFRPAQRSGPGHRFAILRRWGGGSRCWLLCWERIWEQNGLKSMGTNAMSWNRLDGGKPPAWMYETNRVGGDCDWLAHNPEVADPYRRRYRRKTRPEGFAPRGCHAS